MKIAIKTLCSMVLIIAGIYMLPQGGISASNKKAMVIDLNDVTINPITSEYITDAIDKAETEGYSLIICRLDTPGGLLNSTRTIVKRILTSRVPFVTYISPGGSRAGSAGVFITYASHIAVMAPSTNIGAAHPVNIGGGHDTKKDNEWESLKDLLKDKDATEDKESSKNSADQTAPETDQLPHDPNPMETKILEDTVAFIKTLAETKGRNVDWAVKSVAESKSITNEEALKIRVIDYIAKDMDSLLAQIHGRKVKLLDNEVEIDTKDIYVENYPMNGRQKFFNILADPNIAYILMILGFYGLLFEVTHPGFGIPGILGIVFLILAFFSMQTLPTNYAGLALIVLGLIFLIVEAYVPGFGLFAFAGFACLVLGSLFLFKTVDPIMKVSKSLILSFSLTTAAVTLLLLHLSLKTFKAKVISGSQGLMGEIGESKTDFDERGKGKIFVHGELWDAKSTYIIHKGEDIIVKEVDGLKLIVEPVEKKEAS